MKKIFSNKFLNLKFLLTGLVLTSTLALTVWAYSVSGFVGMSGYAWSDTIGWMSMSCKTGGSTGNDICATNNYGVLTSPTKGEMSDYSWNETY